MATAAELLLKYSSLDGTHPASEHFKNIDYGSGGSGDITLNVGWQQIAIPVNKKIKEYLIDWIDNKIKEYDDTKGVTDVVERATAFFGGIGRALSFIPGKTPESHEGNFNLMMEDNEKQEIVAFYIKILDYTAITDGELLVFHWDSADGD